jgi:outer membrane protein insertion porin family
MTHKGKVGAKKRGVFLFLMIVLLAHFLAESCEAVTACSVEIKGLNAIKEDEFLNMFGIGKGGPVSEEGVREGIKRVFLKGLFEDISVEVPDGECPPVKINVRERDFIRKIYVTGDYALSTKVIRNFFLLKEEQVMRYDLVETAVKELRGNIARYGFP